METDMTEVLSGYLECPNGAVHGPVVWKRKRRALVQGHGELEGSHHSALCVDEALQCFVGIVVSTAAGADDLRRVADGHDPSQCPNRNRNRLETFPHDSGYPA